MVSGKGVRVENENERSINWMIASNESNLSIGLELYRIVDNTGVLLEF